MMDSMSYKTFFKNYGLFLAMLAVIMLVLVYSVVLTRRSWQENLRVCVEKVLAENGLSDWAVGEFRELENPFSKNAACYELRNRNSGQASSAVIIRVMTFYGPVAAVFTVSPQDEAVLVGFSSLHGKLGRHFSVSTPNKRVDYWKYRLPEILGQGRAS